jgi:uncharacterized protein (DUF1697 family)
MPVYVSMLRGINVGPHKRIKMDALRECFEALGFEQVRTYIQSGNVVYKAGKIAPLALSGKIEKELLKRFGFCVPVVSRTDDEIGETVSKNPFLKERGIDPEKLHVMFLSDVPAARAVKKLDAFLTAPEQCRWIGKVMYLYLPNGVAESKLMKSPLDRILSVTTTARNWKTVNQLLQMCEECG